MEENDLAAVLDELAASLMVSHTKEQITRLAVGYFAAVEAWESSGRIPDGLAEYHKTVTTRLTGGML